MNLTRGTKNKTGHKETLTRVESDLVACKERERRRKLSFRGKKWNFEEEEEESRGSETSCKAEDESQAFFQEEQRGFHPGGERIDDFVRESARDLQRIEGDIRGP